MKTAALKFGSLLLLVFGVFTLGKHFHVAEIHTAYDAVVGVVNTVLAGLGGRVTVDHVKALLGAGVLLLGLYGFLPRMPRRRGLRVISFDGPHGPVKIQLDPVEVRLNRILKKLPEVKKGKVVLRCDGEGRAVDIAATVVLHMPQGSTARETALLVSDRISEAATEQLGLEDISGIDLNIAGIQVEPKAAPIRHDVPTPAPAPVVVEEAPAPVVADAVVEEAPALEPVPEPEPEPAVVSEAPTPVWEPETESEPEPVVAEDAPTISEVDEAPISFAEEVSEASSFSEEPEPEDFSLASDDEAAGLNTLTVPESEPAVVLPLASDEPRLVVGTPFASADEDVSPTVVADVSDEDSTGFDVIGEVEEAEKSAGEDEEKKDEPPSGWSF